MSAPAPRSVKVPLFSTAEPATPTLPTSRASQPVGSDGALVTVTRSNVDVAVRVVSWLLTATPTYTDPASAIVDRPTSDHETPSAERDAITIWPLRSSF